MNYLITGGAGFIGTHLTHRLLAENHPVTILDDLSSGNPELLLGTRAELVRGSVTDSSLVSRLVARAGRVIHLASVVGVRLAMGRGRGTLWTSVAGTECVLAAAALAGKEVFVASSSAVYGKNPAVPVSEGADSHLGPADLPSWTYSVAKLAGEHLALAYHRDHGVKVKIGRFFNVIGPRQKAGMVVPTLVDQALRSEPLTVYGDGRQTRTFVHVGDALDGLALVIEKGEGGRPYNIGGLEEIAIGDLAARIKVMCGSASPLTFVPYSGIYGPAFEETRRRVPDTSRLRALGYQPRYCLDETLREIITHHRNLLGLSRS